MTPEQQTELERLTREADAAKRVAADAHRRLWEFQKSLSAAQPGDIVSHPRYGECRVVGIGPCFGMNYDRPWLVGVPRKKDGTWGTAQRQLYSDWKVLP